MCIKNVQNAKLVKILFYGSHTFDQGIYWIEGLEGKSLPSPWLKC